jgi:hypothetical protein
MILANRGVLAVVFFRGLLIYYSALSVERVSIISPLINSSSLFVLSFLVAAVAQGDGETHPAQNRRCVSGDLRSLADFLGKKL